MGQSFLECFGFIFSFGNCSPYITRLLREGSEYLRIRNHNLFTLLGVHLVILQLDRLRNLQK
jgi:hypothetical protein